MSSEKEALHRQLSRSVLEMDEEGVRAAASEVVARGLDAYEAIERGLVDGMNEAGRRFDAEEYFVPEILVCSDAMYAGIELLRPHIKPNDRTERHRVVIGVVEGDTHDIGKNLVRILLEAAGFDVIDLGRDVPVRRFVEAAIEKDARVIALSTLMTTTMEGMAEVIRILRAENVRERFKVIVGGGPISQQFADRIGADGYSAKAAEAVQLVRRLVARGEVAA
ncbi:MAG TPA: corrinoid protein [Anaeromyxobacteraceae bacterium]|nr:corrinoid protein [Anaeromyxobacteraceae bacterium]